jgi:hypothetical protein
VALLEEDIRANEQVGIYFCLFCQPHCLLKALHAGTQWMQNL